MRLGGVEDAQRRRRRRDVLALLPRLHCHLSPPAGPTIRSHLRPWFDWSYNKPIFDRNARGRGRVLGRAARHQRSRHAASRRLSARRGPPRPTPTSLGFRMPAEWEPHERCLIGWPTRCAQLSGASTTCWPRRATRPSRTRSRASSRCSMLARPGEGGEARAATAARDVEVVEMPDRRLLDARQRADLRHATRRAIARGVDFVFNSWGEKYLPYDNDAAIGRRLAEHFGVERFAAPMVLEGGAHHRRRRGDADHHRELPAAPDAQPRPDQGRDDAGSSRTTSASRRSSGSAWGRLRGRPTPTATSTASAPSSPRAGRCSTWCATRSTPTSRTCSRTAAGSRRTDARGRELEVVEFDLRSRPVLGRRHADRRDLHQLLLRQRRADRAHRRDRATTRPRWSVCARSSPSARSSACRARSSATAAAASTASRSRCHARRRSRLTPWRSPDWTEGPRRGRCLPHDERAARLRRRLCMQCGTCVGVCPTGSVSLTWDLRVGYRLRVDDGACTDCGRCRDACPGPGLDFSPGAWWRERNEGAPATDFLGPWRRLCFGWACGPAACATQARRAASATALMQAALESGPSTPWWPCGWSPANPLEAEGVSAARRTRSPPAGAPSTTWSPVNTVLRAVLEEPGRYALVGLPCHIQGLRLAQRRSRRLRERVSLALGIFCGLTNEPRATAVLARQAGLDPAALADVSYRGPGWPGGMRLDDRHGTVRRSALPRLHRPPFMALTAAALPPLPRRAGGARRRLRRRRLARALCRLGRRERRHRAHARRGAAARGRAPGGSSFCEASPER